MIMQPVNAKPSLFPHGDAGDFSVMSSNSPLNLSLFPIHPLSLTSCIPPLVFIPSCWLHSNLVAENTVVSE